MFSEDSAKYSSAELFIELRTAVQEGDMDTVKELLCGPQRLVSPNQLDADGCSLLHWAAINNRVQIAKVLIEAGLGRVGGGGILGETPLQWALRKRYYKMMELLVRLQNDLSHKSKQGNDALHLACRLGKHT